MRALLWVGIGAAVVWAGATVAAGLRRGWRRRQVRRALEDWVNENQRRSW